MLAVCIGVTRTLCTDMALVIKENLLYRQNGKWTNAIQKKELGPGNMLRKHETKALKMFSFADSLETVSCRFMGIMLFCKSIPKNIIILR